jgi:hypothetical protein
MPDGASGRLDLRGRWPADARSVLRANAFRDWLWFGTHRPLTGGRRETFEIVVGRCATPGSPGVLVEILNAVLRGRPTDEHRHSASRNFRDLDGAPGPAPTAERWADRLAEGRRTGRVTPTGHIIWGPRGL